MRKSILAPALWLLTGTAAAALSAPLQAQTKVGQSAEADQIDQAWHAIDSKQPAQAVQILDRVIAAEDQAHRGDKRRIYSADSPTESLAYAAIGAKEGKDTVVLGPEWSKAVFLKGFALIDLDRSDEAKPLFDRALELSPLNAQFLGEVGEWHKARHDWDKAFDFFKRAEAASGFMPDETLQKFHLRRALRGQGYVLIERGKLDEAEALFKRSLTIDPNDDHAKSELDYIAEQRAKRETN